MLNEVEVAVQDITPTWVHKYQENGKWKFKVLPVEDTLVRETFNVESAEEDNKLTLQDYERLKEIPGETEEIFWRYQQCGS